MSTMCGLTRVVRRIIHSPTRSARRACRAAVSLSWTVVAPVQAGPIVELTRIDGTSVKDAWLGAQDGASVRVGANGGEVVFPIDELSSARFEHPIKPPPAATVFFLADGGRLYGLLRGGAPAAVVGQTVLSDSTRLPFDRLAGVRLTAGEEFVKSEELFAAAMQARLPGQDVLVTCGEEVLALRGRLESLDSERGTFEFAERTRTIQTDKIYGIVFASGVAKNPSFTVAVEMVDGSVFSGNLERGDDSTIRVAASFGSSVDVPLISVARMRFFGARVVYVSDLAPKSEWVEGLVHAPWPVRKDRNASNQPITLGGRVFDRGLGVHSKTELEYEIGGGFETFVAVIGLDDLVRPLGDVVFRVLGDGKPLFDSGTITGRDEPRDVRVELNSVKTLTLIVDYGEGADVGDQADWAGARLLKPAGGSR